MSHLVMHSLLVLLVGAWGQPEIREVVEVAESIEMVVQEVYFEAVDLAVAEAEVAGTVVQLVAVHMVVSEIAFVEEALDIQAANIYKDHLLLLVDQSLEACF